MKKIKPELAGFYRVPIRAGIFLLGVILLLAIFAPFLAPFSPLEPAGKSLEPPSLTHPFGTDDVGHDLFSQFLYGARISLLVGISVGTAGALLSLLIGGFAGYMGKWVEQLIMRGVDIFLSLPRLPIMIILSAFLGSGLGKIILFLVLFSWPAGARLVRSLVISLKNSPLVEAERLFGARPHYIFFRHIFPDLVPLLVAIFVVDATHSILIEAGLSFLGLGDPSVVSWGTILHYAFIYPGIFLESAWLWWILPAGLGISFLVMGLMLISTALEAKIKIKPENQIQIWGEARE